MYPEFLHTLARQHEAELLERRRLKPTRDVVPPRRRGPTLFQRARRAVGTALVVAGTRLHGGAPGGVELFDSRG